MTTANAITDESGRMNYSANSSFKPISNTDLFSERIREETDKAPLRDYTRPIQYLADNVVFKGYRLAYAMMDMGVPGFETVLVEHYPKIIKITAYDYVGYCYGVKYTISKRKNL